MEFRVLGGALWRQRLLVLLILAVTALGVGAGILLAPKTYTATATVTLASADGGRAPSESVLSTVAELASSRVVAQDVRQRVDTDAGADELRRFIVGSPVPGSVLVRVTAEADDPVRAARLANVTATVLPLHDPTDGGLSYTIESYAQAPVTFSSPDLLISLVAGAILALILAICGALVRDYRVNTVDDAAGVEEASVAPLLAHVAAPEDPTTLPALYPGTAAAEVFRQLRGAVEDENSRVPAHRVVVAGVGSGDVAMWLGSNLAISMAHAGRRILLVDGRAAGGGALAGEDPEVPGLFDVLLGVELDDALVAGPVDDLWVLPSGVWDLQGTRNLLQNQFVEAMTAFQDRFDFVVVLAPPLGAGDEALVMSAGGMLLQAVPQRGVTATALRAHSDRVRAVGARLLGSVLVGRVERGAV